jgi:hypothetical protein
MHAPARLAQMAKGENLLPVLRLCFLC